MTWLNTPPGDGWKLAGPNAPLDGTILFFFFIFCSSTCVDILLLYLLSLCVCCCYMFLQVST